MSVNVRQYPSMFVNDHNVRYLTDIDGRGPPSMLESAKIRWKFTNPPDAYKVRQSPPKNSKLLADRGRHRQTVADSGILSQKFSNSFMQSASSMFFNYFWS